MFADRKRLFLGGGIVVIVAIVLWMQFTAASPAPTAPPARPRPVRPVAGAADEEPLRPVKLGTLTAGRAEPNDTERNPFRFAPKPAPAVPKPVVPISKAPEVASAPVVPAGPPPPPPIPLKFLGVLTRQNGVQWAVLTDGKAPPFYGREGDIVDGRYRIVKIGAESIELAYADGKGRQTVRLSGQ